MKNRNRLLFAVLLVFVIVVLVSVVINSEAQLTGEIGRYQAATAYRDNGNWVFVTVIDTTTGRIVSQERFGGYKAYEPKKSD